MAPNDQYVRRATLVRVIDGDTYEMRVDLGYRVEGRFMIRVRDLNTPEMNTIEGQEAKQKAETIFTTMVDGKSPVIIVRSYKDVQSFARWVADVYVNGESMVTLMQTSVVG